MLRQPGSILSLLHQRPDKALALLKTLRDDDAGGSTALQGQRPSWHAAPQTPIKLETPPKVEPRKKAVIRSKAKKSLGMLVEQYNKKKEPKPTALKKRKYESSDEEVSFGEEEKSEDAEEEYEATASSDDEPKAPTPEVVGSAMQERTRDKRGAEDMEGVPWVHGK